MVPGLDEQTMKEQFIGRSSADALGYGERAGSELTLVERWRLALHFARNTLGLLRHHAREAQEYASAVAGLLARAQCAEALTPDELDDLLTDANDLVVTGWYIGGRNVMAVQIWTAMASKVGRTDANQVTTADGILASTATLGGVRMLATAAKQDAAVQAALRTPGDDVEGAVRAASQDFALLLDEALRTFGHRGPGECELANSTWSDRPDRLLRAVARELSAGSRQAVAPTTMTMSKPGRPALQRAIRAQVVREEARDHLVRVTHALRRLARERGRRLVDMGLLAEQDDVWFLTFSELRRPPKEVRTLVVRRREERARLADVPFPPLVLGTWGAPQALRHRAGDVLMGVGASAGCFKGRVRVVDSDSVDDLEPGEVLVASTTDVGFTASFGFAGAVVVDIGGLMSHSAIVAREFAIPAVVDARNASTGLRTGDLVVVDGREGTVTLIAQATL
jgi:phosphohistidine swiveling domain-containing protein